MKWSGSKAESLFSDHSLRKMPMRQETKRALLRELEDRGVQLDLEDDGRDATAKDVIRSI